MTRVLATGDLHIGSGMDYGRTPGERLDEQEAVWNQIVDVAIEREVDVLLFGGDAVERRRPTPSEVRAFVRPLRRLKTAGIDALAIAGNHDVEAFDRPTAMELFDGLLDVHREPGIWNTRGLSVVTLPWTPVANLVARNGGGDRDELNARAAELLLNVARELHDTARFNNRNSGSPVALLLHWSVSGASLPTGLPTDTLREPVIPLAELESLGFDAIVCGHIHRAQVSLSGQSWRTDVGKWVDSPNLAHPILYVGSPMPLNFGEASVGHGVWILDLDADHVQIEFVPIESRPFKAYRVRTQEIGPHVGIDLPLDYDEAIVKITIDASADEARRLDVAAIRHQLLEGGDLPLASGDWPIAHKVYAVNLNIEREARTRVEGLDEGLAPLEALFEYVKANDIDPEAADAMGERTARYLEAVA